MPHKGTGKSEARRAPPRHGKPWRGSDAVVGRGGRPDTWVTDSARAPRGPAALQPEPDGGLQPSTLVADSQPAASIRQAIAIDPSIAAAATPWPVGERAARSAT